MKSGSLTTRVNFYTKVTARDSYGASSDTYPYVTKSTRGELRWLGGSRTASNEEKTFTKSMELTVRYQSAITETMRVQLDNGTETYGITYIEVLGRKEALRLSIEKIGNEMTPVVFAAPTSLILTVLSDTSIRLNWTNNSTTNISGISIERSLDGVTWSELTTVASTVSTYTNTGLTADTTYYYRVRCYLDTQYSAYTNTDYYTTLISSILSVATPLAYYDSDHYELTSGKVSTLTDLSGNARNLTAAAEANRPTLTLASLNGHAKITFDGVSNMLTTAAFNMTQPFTVYSVVDIKARDIGTANGGDVSGFNVGVGVLGATGYTPWQDYAGSSMTGRSQGGNKIKTVVSIFNGATSVNYDNGVKFTGNVGTWNITTGWCEGTYDSNLVAAQNYDFYCRIIFSGVHDYATTQKIIRYLSNVYATDFGENERLDTVFDNAITYSTSGGEFERRSSYSEFSFNTTDTTIYVTANPRISTPSYARLSVYIDDDFYSDVYYTTWAEQAITVPSGNKKVTLVESMNALSSYAGTHITSVVAKNFTKVNNGNIAEKIVFIGDSIAVGDGATNPEREGFARLFRTNDDKQEAFYAYGAATLNAIASKAGYITTTVGYVTTLFSNVTTTKNLLIEMGTNDAGAGVAHATFKTWYGNLLDAIHAADATIKIYCLSPLNRTDGAAEALLVDYRTDIGDLCTARAAYCTHINGNGIINPALPADSADGLHPTTAGHLKVYNAVNTVMYP
jgi:head-tail adaptor/lysophospholipase L1-like esterase